MSQPAPAVASSTVARSSSGSPLQTRLAPISSAAARRTSTGSATMISPAPNARASATMEQSHRSCAENGDTDAGAEAAGLERVEHAGRRFGECGAAPIQRRREFDGVSLGDQLSRQEHLLWRGRRWRRSPGFVERCIDCAGRVGRSRSRRSDDWVHGDAVAKRETVDAVAERDDLAGELVAGHDAGFGVLLTAVDAQVGGADAGGADFNHRLTGPRRGRRQVADPNLAGSFKDQCSHGGALGRWWLLRPERVAARACALARAPPLVDAARRRDARSVVLTEQTGLASGPRCWRG